jgi:hypothetical protein
MKYHLLIAAIFACHVQFLTAQPAFAVPKGFTELRIGDKAPDFDLSDGDIKPLEVRHAIVERLGRTYANRIQK